MQANTTSKEKSELISRYSYLKAGAKAGRETTTNIKKHLAKEFPGVAFSIKTQKSSLCTSIYIDYTDGDTMANVEKAVKIFEYDHSGSDIMTDYFESMPTDFTKIFGGADYIHVKRHLSDTFRAELETEIANDLPADLVSDLKRGEMKREEFLTRLTGSREIIEKYIKASGAKFWINFSGLVWLLSYNRSRIAAKEAGTQTQTNDRDTDEIQDKQDTAKECERLEVVEYSERAIAVFGDTKAIKEQLKEIGGRFNPALNRNGEKCPGWIFSKKQEEKVRALIKPEPTDNKEAATEKEPEQPAKELQTAGMPERFTYPGNMVNFEINGNYRVMDSAELVYTITRDPLDKTSQSAPDFPGIMEKITPAKRLLIEAGIELYKRYNALKNSRISIQCSEDAAKIMRPILDDCKTEEFWALFLNNANKVIKKSRISAGGYNETTVDIRVILREAVTTEAAAVIVCHNHPAGNPSPSITDQNITKSLKKAFEAVGISFLDHVIIAGDRSYSFADERTL